jgi:hypothetical protein
MQHVQQKTLGVSTEELKVKLAVHLAMQQQLFYRVIYNLKKVLVSLHTRLQHVLIVQQNTNQQT